MTDVVTIEYFNEVHMKVISNPGVRQELREYFSYQPEGYQFSPKFKARVWDGYIRMYNPMSPLLYVGLIGYIRKFCEARGYDLEINERAQEQVSEQEDIPDDYVQKLIEEIKSPFEARDYQIDYVLNALRNRRSLSLSPTSSGKSFILYLIQQHYYRNRGTRTLVVVPTISLVHQMAGDFVDYGCDPGEIFKIQGGVDKTSTLQVKLELDNDTIVHKSGNDKIKLSNGKFKIAKDLKPKDILALKAKKTASVIKTNHKQPSIYISTWQSLVKQSKDWFSQFGLVLGDEAHNFKAQSLQTIMDKLVDCPYRFGFTGTISSDSKVHRLVLEGVFGPVKRYVSTKELIDRGTVADFKIKALVLEHSTETRQLFKEGLKKIDKKRIYHAERQFIINSDKRNNFIKNLVHSLENQNNLILFDLVEAHGKVLEPLLRKEGRILHFIHGDVSGEERERIRHEVENDPLKRHDILASSGTFSTGVNLKRIDNAIFATIGKSEIKVLQSIGRILRKGNGSDDATLYDIADNLSYGSFENYTLRHFRKRIEIYSAEEFDFQIYNIPMK